MYTDEKVNNCIKTKDFDGLRAMYDSGEIKHGEYMRALERAQNIVTVNLAGEEYSKTLSTLHTVYNRILLFVVADLILSYFLKFVVLKQAISISLIIYLIVVYIPILYCIWKIRAFKLKNLNYPTPEIKSNTLALRVWLFVQFIPIVSIIADFILLYYSLSCKLHLKNMEKNDRLKA